MNEPTDGYKGTNTCSGGKYYILGCRDALNGIHEAQLDSERTPNAGINVRSIRFQDDKTIRNASPLQQVVARSNRGRASPDPRSDDPTLAQRRDLVR